MAPIQTDLFFDGQVKVAGPASKALGAFFTPTPLVRTLAEQSLSRVNLKSKHIHIFDPACGSGEFLREAVRQLALRDYKGKIQITGYDISAPACLMAQFVCEINNRSFVSDRTWPKPGTGNFQAPDSLRLQSSRSSPPQGTKANTCATAAVSFFA